MQFSCPWFISVWSAMLLPVTDSVVGTNVLFSSFGREQSIVSPLQLCWRLASELSKPRSSSFTWRSVLFGRELLKKGVRWGVGEGSCIKILTDNWIPGFPLVTFAKWGYCGLLDGRCVQDMGCRQSECFFLKKRLPALFFRFPSVDTEGRTLLLGHMTS